MIIFAFVFAFSNPETSGIIVIVSQSLFTIYAFFLPWIKLRYRIINALGNALLVGLFICSMGCGTTKVLDSTWNSFKEGYYVIIIIMCSLLILVMIGEIVVQRHFIYRVLKEGKRKYCCCE